MRRWCYRATPGTPTIWRKRRFWFCRGSRTNFVESSGVYTWLYGILLNLERSQRRRRGLIRQKLQVVWHDESENRRASPTSETVAEVAEWKRSLWSHVAELPDAQRYALTLRFSEQLSYADR